MNFTRKTLFWVITLVFLAGSFHLLDREAEETKRVAEIKQRLFPFDAAQVESFQIVDAGEVRARVNRDGEGWRLETPLAAKGDKKAIDTFLLNVLQARRDAVLFDAPSPEKLAELGLDQPGLEIAFTVQGRTTAIAFGNKGPTNNVSYARFKGRTEVLRIHSDVKQEADQSVYQLRDKTVVDFVPLETVRMELLRRGQKPVIVHHEQDRWDMIEPEQARAAMANVLETLYTVKNGEIKAFIHENPEDPAVYGLDEPAIVLALLHKDAQQPQRLLIGNKDRAQRGYFAKREGEPVVFLLEEPLVHNLMADHGKWREE